MIFNKHSELAGMHAFLSPSQNAWLNYTDEKLATVYQNMLKKSRGTELHDFARRAIELGIKLPKTQKTLNMYVNDAIGYRMSPEQILFYSDNCFGTADAICFRANKLRIHDLKTGDIPASPKQLEIYAALFCLEYAVEPGTIQSIELRIYQSDEIHVTEPSADEIRTIMHKIIVCDDILERMKTEGL